MLLFLQLMAGMIPTFAAHRQLTLHHNQLRVQATEDRLQNLLNSIPIHLEADDDGIDTWHLTKNRRKTRYYISANAPQVSTPTRIVYLDTNLSANSIYHPVDKTGEYQKQKSFLPAYYSFLFRFKPF
ncbi:hypothetical protein [Chitinophaga silvatica]|nr:hypothetical protein [Chitinophaga silvatica]